MQNLYFPTIYHMPQSPPSICNKCKNPKPCNCKPIVSAFRKRKQSLYNCTRWRKKRLEQLSLFPLCKLCEENGIVEVASIADHLTDHHGSEEVFWASELQSLCASCHNSKSATGD